MQYLLRVLAVVCVSYKVTVNNIITLTIARALLWTQLAHVALAIG